MISCTEFVPLYSDFFWYLERIGGHKEVEKYWEYVAEHRLGDKNNPKSLVACLERHKDEPFDGTHEYWGPTLDEEKADTMGIGGKAKGFTFSCMRRCPSKGKLLEVKHIEPYYDYCGHCPAIFTGILARYGLTYEMDLTNCHKAQCTSLLYRTGHRPPQELLNFNSTEEISERRAEDHVYFHPGFHVSCDIALRYCGLLFGDDEVRNFLAGHTRNYYAPQIKEISEGGIPALAKWIEWYFTTEKAADRLHMEVSEDKLTVTIDSDPAISFMRELNHTPCKNHKERTRTVLATVCEDCGWNFEMHYYNEDGGTSYTVTKCK